LFKEIFERSVKIKSATSELALATRLGAEQNKDSAAVKKEAPVEHAAQVMLAEPLWTKPYVAYLLRGELPKDLVHRRQIICRCKSFAVINRELYKRSTTSIH
jgi:hypothetical protein